jgi:broad specificity phosphatase PhoE
VARTLPDGLLQLLAPSGLASSPSARCTQTLEPLAARTGLRVRTHPALVPEGSVRQVVHLLERLPARAVVCTHGEVISRLFDGLDCEKGAFLVVARDGPGLRPIRYVPPPTPARTVELVGLGALSDR